MNVDTSKVIFLDIDGVIKKNGSAMYCQFDSKQLAKDLTKKYKADYKKYINEGLNTAFYGWDNQAIDRLKEIIRQTSAKIVISSSWKYHPLGLKRLIDFFRIYNLDKEIIGITDNLGDGRYFSMELKQNEILHYLNKHPHIESFVIIDDNEFNPNVSVNFVQTDILLSDENVIQCIQILNKNF